MSSALQKAGLVKGSIIIISSQARPSERGDPRRARCIVVVGRDAPDCHGCAVVMHRGLKLLRSLS